MKIISKNDVLEKEEKEYENLIKKDDADWETGDYGKNKKHMVKATPHEEEKINEILGKKKNQKIYSIKMPEEMVEKLKLLAVEKNIGYQTLIKVIASDYIKKNLKKAS